VEEIRRYTPVRRFGSTFSISGSLPVNNAYHRALPLLGRKLLAKCASTNTLATRPQEAVWEDVCEFARVHRLGTPGSSSFEKDNLYALMRAVFRCGGMQVVVGMNAWKYVSTNVAAGCNGMDYVKAKKFYAKWAYPYEHMLVFGEMVHKHVHLLLWRYNWKNQKYPTTTVAKPPAPVARLEKASIPNSTNINTNKASDAPASPERIQPTPQHPNNNSVQVEQISSSEQINVVVQVPSPSPHPVTAPPPCPPIASADVDMTVTEHEVENDNGNNHDEGEGENKVDILIPIENDDVNNNIPLVGGEDEEELSLPDNTNTGEGVVI